MTQSGHSMVFAVQRVGTENQMFPHPGKEAILRYRYSPDLEGCRDLTCDDFPGFVGGKADFEHRATAGRVRDIDCRLMGLDHPLDDG